jgi:PAS domain S-box-containing protein
VTVDKGPGRQIEVVAWAAVLAVFALSLWADTQHSLDSLYIVGILLAIRAPNPKVAYRLAALATVLLAAGTLLEPNYPLATHAFTAAMSIGAFWLTAVVAAGYRRSGAALREAEQAIGRYSKDLEHMQYALDQSAIVAMTDVQGTITYANDRFCEISKYSREELIGRTHRLVNSGFHSSDFFRDLYRTIAAGRVWRGEIRNRAKDGTLYWVDTTIVPFLDERGRPQKYIAIRYDITERKRSEAAMRAQTSLVQLGKMAAIVAHEVRNPLAGIRGAMQVMGRRLTPGSPEHGIVNEVVTRIDTLNDIVQDLLLFARPRQPMMETIPVAELMRETVSLLKEDPKFEGIAIRMNETDVKVAADPEQLKLVLMNLLINSAQAMEGKGDIDVVVRVLEGWVELRIIDQGPGIPPEAREHLFEPFFTTKHRGTGLGLPTARRILEGHGGTLELDCPPSGGTIAIVRLPVR